MGSKGMNRDYFCSAGSVPLLQRDHGSVQDGAAVQAEKLQHSPQYSLITREKDMFRSFDGPQADSNHRSGFEERVTNLPDAGNAERGKSPRNKASPEITTILQEKRCIPNEEKPSASELEGGLEDKTKSDNRNNNRKLNLWILNDEKRNNIPEKLERDERPNRFTVKEQNCVYLQGLNPPQTMNPERLQEYATMRKNYTVVRPNRRRSSSSDTALSCFNTISDTRKFAFHGTSKVSNNISASEPHLKDERTTMGDDSELRNSGSLGSKNERSFEGARYLFSKLTTRKLDDSFLVITREPLTCRTTDANSITTPAKTQDYTQRILLDEKTLTKDSNSLSTREKNGNVSNFKRLLERQQAFEEECCYDDVDGDGTMSLLAPIVGLIDDHHTRTANETHSYVDDDNTKCREAGGKSSQITISSPSEISTGGREWILITKDGEMLDRDDQSEKDKIYQPTKSFEDTRRLDKSTRWKVTSLSYPAFHGGEEFIEERQPLNVNGKRERLISNCNEDTAEPLEKEISFLKREKHHFIEPEKKSVEVDIRSYKRQKNGEPSQELLRVLNSNYIKTSDFMDIANKASTNHPLKMVKKTHSVSTPTLDTKRRHVVSVPSIPLHNVKTTDITMGNKADEHPGTSASGDLNQKKRNRVKLALSTSHAGIYVTGDSQDDTTSSDSPMGRSFERCPSWIGRESHDSPYLSPYYQPSSNEEKEESPVTFVQKRKVSPISLVCTKQKSNSSEKDSWASWSPHSKTSGFSVHDSGFEASGRHSNALLSPSFRKMTLPSTSHSGMSTSGEMYSSEEYFEYTCEGGMLSPAWSQEPKRTESRKRKVAIGANDSTLLSPTFKARSFEESGSQTHKLSHPYCFSNSTEGDSGLETPHSTASQSTHQPRGRVSTQSSVTSRGPHDRSSRFSIQSRLSSKSSMKSAGSSAKFSNRIESLKGSFLSFLSPKNFFGSRRGSETGKSSSCGSKSSRKQLADFPDDNKILLVNVSGRRFKLHEYFTTVYPETLLGNIKRNEYYDAKKGEFFFDRDPDIFRHIWNFYYTGKLHFPKDECVNHFVDEISFFGVDDEYLCTCCWEDEFEPAVEKLEKLRKEVEKKEEERLVKTRRIPENASLREKIWLTTKDPVVSTQAKIFYFFSMMAIVISTVASIIETIPCSRTLQICKENNQDLYFYIDSGCVGFFTLEYLLRLITAPRRLHFVRKFMSIIDLLAIAPYYCDILMRQIFGPSLAYGISLLEILRILRIVRVFKLLKHSRRLQALVSTFKSSTAELSLIVFIYLVLVTVFASVIYYAEMQDNPKYSSIPESMWYAVITTTTTGYGDIVPETILGKLIGCACCLLGVLIVALPVPILQIR